jgi:poly(A) polymerase
MLPDTASRTFAIEVVRRLRQAGHAALWAGGCVRDLCMDRQPQDYDVATDAPPEAVRSVFGRRRTIAVGESFGVVIVLGPRGAQQVEVATFRTEGPYLDGRRPDSVRFASPEEDAQRRDFTINGMFYDPLEQRIYDYVGGEKDLHDGVVRAIGEPHERMAEDKLRMLRAIRFAATLDFELDSHTADAVRDMAPEILVVSWERIAQELRKMLVNRHRRRAMRLCQQLGLSAHIFPELSRLLSAPDEHEWTHTLNVLDALRGPPFELTMAVLLHTLPAASHGKRDAPGTAAEVCRRLRLSNHETVRINWLVANQRTLQNAEQQERASLKRVLAHPGAAMLVEMMRASAAAEHVRSADVQFLDDFLEQHTLEDLNPPELVTGADLIAMGLKPSRRFQDLLNRIRDTQLNEQVQTRQEALNLLQGLVASLPPDAAEEE